MADDGSDFKLYRYVPSMAAAVIFAILFLAITAIHLYQMVRTRTWIFIPFTIGGFFQVVGYCGRAKSSNESPNYQVGTYSLQTILLLVAPALYAASIYMILGRIILVTDGEYPSMIRRKWLTKIFVIGDVLSFVMQGGGGGIMASGTIDMLHTGEKIIIAGLVVQLLFFGCFMVTSAVFHVRLCKNPTTAILARSIPWERQIYVLYGASLLILVRSLFRLIEYAQGNSGYLISHEKYMYGFDAVLMLATMVLTAVFHPSEITSLLKEGSGKAVRNVVQLYTLA